MPCSLLVFTFDKERPGLEERDHELYKTGDVVAVLPVDWQYGTEEVVHPWFRVVRVADLDEADGLALQHAESGPDGTMLRKRATHIDPAKLAAGLLADLTGASRAEDMLMTKAEVMGAITTKPVTITPQPTKVVVG